ncbi:hypothetical protein [[Eubacterium] cellulosolvens]
MKKWSGYGYLISFIIIFIVIESLLINFLIISGLEIRIQEIAVHNLSFSLPILFLPLLAFFFYMIACWDYAIKRHYEKFSGSIYVGKSARYRLLSRSTFILFTYSLFSFMPLVLSSNLTVNGLSTLIHTVPSLKNSAYTLLQAISPFINLNMVLRFGVLHFISLTAVTFLCLILGRQK